MSFQDQVRSAKAATDTDFLYADGTSADGFDDAKNLAESHLMLLNTAGTVKVTTEAGDTVTMAGLAVGVVHPIRVLRVWATGTSAGLQASGALTLCKARRF